MITSIKENFISEEYIQTSGGNIVSRKASIFKPQSCELPAGRVILHDHVIIRADLATIQINKYTIIHQNTIIRPSYTIISNNGLRYIPITIGSNTFIGEDCVIEAASIGIGCYIGNNCVLGKRCILKDYARVESNTVVPPDMVIPPFAIVDGKPGQIIGEVNESITTLASMEAIARYKRFTPVSTSTKAT